MLDTAKAVYAVAFESGRTLRYIHKRWNDRHTYFFANLTPTLAESVITRRGRLDLEAWDPHTGKLQVAQATCGTRAGTDVTQVRLALPYLRSLFLVSAPGAAYPATDTVTPAGQ